MYNFRTAAQNIVWQITHPDSNYCNTLSVCLLTNLLRLYMKNLSSLIPILLICFLSISCNEDKKTETPQPIGSTMERSADIRIVSSTGEDLLDPANENGIKRFKVSYLNIGVENQNNLPALNSYSGFVLQKNPILNYYYLHVMLNHSNTSLEATTYLQLGFQGSIDTIRTLYRAPIGKTLYIMPEKIWYNSKLVWPTANGGHAFEIIKP